MGKSTKNHGKCHIHGKSHIHGKNDCDQCKSSLIKPPSPLPHQIHNTQYMEAQDSVSHRATPTQLPSCGLSSSQQQAWGSGREDSPLLFCSSSERAARWGPIPKLLSQFCDFSLTSGAGHSSPGCWDDSEPVFQGCLLTPLFLCVDSATFVRLGVLHPYFHLNPRVPPHSAQKLPSEHQTRSLAQIYRL